MFGLAGDDDGAGLAPDPAAAARIVVDPVVNTQQRNHRSGGKGNPGRQGLQVFQDPAAVVFGEFQGLTDRRAPRQHHDDAVAGLADAQADAPGPRMALQFHRHFAFGHLQTAGPQGLEAQGAGSVKRQWHDSL